MAAGAVKFYGAALEAIWRGTVDMDSNAFRMVLVGAGYTPNQSTDAAWSTISGNELAAGGGYATHGKLLVCTIGRVGLAVTFDCDDQTWTAATFTAKWAVIVRDADANGALVAGDLPVCYFELEAGGTVSPIAGSLVVSTPTGLVVSTAS